MKKNQMVRVMRSLAYIFVSVFCVALFNSCAIRKNLQARIEHRRLFKEMQFSLDSIKKIASAYQDDHFGHTYEFCNWQNRKTPSYVFFFGTNGGGFTHFADGSTIKDKEEYSQSELRSTAILDSCNNQASERFERAWNIAYILFYEDSWVSRPEICVTKEMDNLIFDKR